MYLSEYVSTVAACVDWYCLGEAYTSQVLGRTATYLPYYLHVLFIYMYLHVYMYTISIDDWYMLRVFYIWIL